MLILWSAELFKSTQTATDSDLKCSNTTAVFDFQNEAKQKLHWTSHDNWKTYFFSFISGGPDFLKLDAQFVSLHLSARGCLTAHVTFCFLHQKNTLFLSVSVCLQPPADPQAAGVSVRPANCSSLHSPAGTGVTQSLIIRGLEWKAARRCSNTASEETSDLLHIQSSCVSSLTCRLLICSHLIVK